MEGEWCYRYLLLAKSFQHIIRKMKSGSGCCHGPWFLGKDSLVALSVLCISLAPDIGGEGNIPSPFQPGRKIGTAGKPQGPTLLLPLAGQLGRYRIIKVNEGIAMERFR
jgi:hypothetical protein